MGKFILGLLEKIKEEHPIVGEVRGKGCLLGIELVKDRKTKEPFVEAGRMVYQEAFRRGLAWVPADHILRLSPQIIMDKETAAKGIEIIEEAIGITERRLGAC